MKCPVCDSPMELVTVVRKAKGSAQAIKCPTCRTSTFLTKEAAARLQSSSDHGGAGAASDAAPNIALPPSIAVQPERAPTSLFEDFLAWLGA